MMWGYGFSWGGMFLMLLGMALWIALLVVLVWAIIRWLDRRNTAPPTQGPGKPATGPSALEILRQRYARGKIDTATFEQMRERLAASGAREDEPTTGIH
jgi:putative membrane protein